MHPNSKLYPSPTEALFDVPDGATIMIGGFVTAGTPDSLVAAMVQRGVRDLTCIANNIGLGDTIDSLCVSRQLRKMIASFAIRASAARSSTFEQQYRAGDVELELVPQGTLAERIRAGGAGITGFFTPTGAGTLAAEGKEIRVIDGRECVFELPLRADFALIRAYQADPFGNLTYRGAQRNFNAIMATAADVVIAEVDEYLSESHDPERVVTPGIYVDRVVVGERHDIDWNL